MFTISWAAVDPQLINYWMKAESEARRAITTAVNRLDKRLRQRPQDGTMSDDPDFLTLEETPVRIFYRVDDGTREVTVVSMAIYEAAD